MRLSIPPGTEVKGKKSKYIVENIVGISERSITVLCRDNKNQKHRLKVFDGDSSINSESYKFFIEVKTRGLLPLEDYGEISGRPFYVYRNYNVQNVEQQVISIDLLVKRIIPQISYVMNQVHSRRYLLRDISAEHLLFDANANEIMFIGLSNFVKLQGKSTATKEAGYGQHYSYIAPEVEQYGYSPASDYFSLGVLLLSIIKGRNVIQDISRNTFIEGLKAGKVPGIDVAHLKNTPSDMYSIEDKVLYLILGLMIPNPNQRWGYGEIKCWCNNQFIPLVRNGDRVNYQYSEPFILGNNKCWNDKQIAEVLSSASNFWTKASYEAVYDYLKKQKSQFSAQIENFNRDDNEYSRIFKTIYTLYPAMNGFVWKGKKYKDTYEIVDAVKNNSLHIGELQAILRNECFSYFQASRLKLGISDKIDIKEITSLEKLEQLSPGEGASRCMVLLAPNKQGRYFEIEGKKYHNSSDFLSAYKGKELRLKEISEAVVKEQSFQAWLWSKGFERLGKEALNGIKINAKNSFTILLTIFEKCSENDKDKKIAREMFLKYGDLAPIVWLVRNITYYKNESRMNTGLYDRLKNIRIDLNKSIQELNQLLSGYVGDYQLFVQNTLDNPLVLEFGKDNSVSYDFQPIYESGFFCEQWNDLLEVCPAFLHSVNGKLDNQKIRSWLSSCGDKQREILHNVTDGIDTKDTSGVADYVKKCKKNQYASTVIIMIATVFMFTGFRYPIGFVILSYAVAVIYPIRSITWYHQKKVRAEIWYRTYKQQAEAMSSLHSLMNCVAERENDIYQRLVKHINAKCVIKDSNQKIDTVSLDDLEALDLFVRQKNLVYLSTLGFVILSIAALGWIPIVIISVIIVFKMIASY